MDVVIISIVIFALCLLSAMGIVLFSFAIGGLLLIIRDFIKHR